MKIQQFRIGNLAQDSLSKELLICSGLSCDNDGKNPEISFSVLDREKYPLPNGWKAQQIPLSEEWLLKLGFEFIKRGARWQHPERAFELKMLENGRFLLFRWGYNLEMEIKYVHTLQNTFFSLTEDELKLIK